MFSQKNLSAWLIAIIGLLLGFSISWAQPEPGRAPDLRIKLATFTFDPLERMPTISDSLLIKEPPESSAYRIVQFKHALTRKQSEYVKTQFGLKLAHYIPNHAFLEKVSQGMLDSLGQLEYFRWSGLYQPAYKISPGIGTLEFRTPERQAMTELLLRAILFPDADTSSIAETLRNTGATEIKVFDDRKIKGPIRIIFKFQARDSLFKIARLEMVRWIEEVAEIIDDNVNTSGTMQSGTPGTTPLWNNNLNGQGQIIGMIDSSPLDINHCFFQDPINNTPRPDHRKVLAIRNASGTAAGGHATFTSGNAAGDDFNNPGAANRRGGAWGSRLVSGNNRDITGGLTTLLAELNAAAATGATIHSNSWHDNTAGAGNPATYNQTAADVDNFTWNNEDHLVLGSAGNNGEEQGPPGTAKNAICVGASLADPNEMFFGDGNNGPTADGRSKPDLMTPGCGIQSATVNTACATGPRAACATSYSTPHTAAAAALTRQYYIEGWYPSGTKQPHNAFVPSGALIKATLLNSTIDMTGIAGYPGNKEGWGLILLDNSLYFAGDAINAWVWDVRHINGLYSEESHNYNFTVADNGQPLKITLVWTEPPASSGSASPVINDLDLVVIAPDNVTTYFGNDINTATGVSNANGGVNDNVNNVEMVILNTPPVGTYTLIIREGANSINQGGQGYALVATADTPEPPIPTGDQNTLVVRVGMSDILAGAAPPLTTVQNIMTDVANYFTSVGYGTVTVSPEYPPPVTLGNPSAHYYHPSRNVLIEMSEEVIDKLITANANVLDKGTAATADDIDRIVIVLNDQNFTGDWATTGPWPYDLPGGLTRRISVSVQSVFNDPERRFAHGLAHQFGLIDLYAHPNVVFAQPHVDEWDIMAMPPQRCGMMAWSKERATWITTHGSTIEYIPRPASGASYNNTLGINFLTSTNQDRKAIAIGMSEGATNLEDEDVFYFIEARTNTAGGPDDVLPEEGVLLYHVNENIRQGVGPVQITDDVVSTLSLSDAALEINDSQSPPGRGLTITIQNGSGTADRDIQISYDPPETDNDVNIRVGNPVWTSTDIWVDSQKDGFDEDEGRTPADRGDQPVTGEVNRIYVRVFNPGPGDAYDFTIYVRVSEPYHTVGGAADFNTYVGEIYVPTLAPANSPFIDYVEWTPAEDGDPHTCVWVEIPNVFNDINQLNNHAQQNLTEVPSTRSSAYEIVTYDFSFTNPEDNQELFYFRAEDVPDGWTAELNPKKALLSANQRIECALTITPLEDAPVCTEHRISVTSWTPRGNTLVQVGGGTVQVDLRNRTDLSLTTEVGKCPDSDSIEQVGYYMGTRSYDVVYHAGYQQTHKCLSIITQGCTSPPKPFEEIVIRYEDPSGYPIYRTVTTDEYGCYSDFYFVAEGGTWEVTAHYPGNDCDGPATTSIQYVGISLEQTGDQDGDGLSDQNEPQGDHDRDGIIGIFDRDSDNDGIVDGEELPGDCDRDGHKNVVDADSDNDGIIDGKDSDICNKGKGPWHRNFLYSFHLGSVHPLGDLDSLTDANVHAHIDLNYIFKKRIWLVIMVGLSQFTAESSSGIDHPRWGNASLNAQLISPLGSGLRYYLRGGPGSYWPKSGPTEVGFNLGAGGLISIGGSSNLSFGIDYHQIQTKKATRFLTLQLGVIYR